MKNNQWIKFTDFKIIWFVCLRKANLHITKFFDKNETIARDEILAWIYEIHANKSDIWILIQIPLNAFRILPFFIIQISFHFAHASMMTTVDKEVIKCLNMIFLNV